MSPYSPINIPKYEDGKDFVLDIPDMRSTYLSGGMQTKKSVKDSIEYHIEKLSRKIHFDDKTFDIYDSAIVQLLKLKDELVTFDLRDMVV
jgi:hypothetical protein